MNIDIGSTTGDGDSNDGGDDDGDNDGSDRSYHGSDVDVDADSGDDLFTPAERSDEEDSAC